MDKRKEAAMRDIHRQAGLLLLVLSALLLATSGTATAAETWVDEIWGMVNFEKATYPSSNFDPYFEKLTVIREGLARHDRQAVKKETDRFLKMLADRAHGINDVAADEIYNFALGVRPPRRSPRLPCLNWGLGTSGRWACRITVWTGPMRARNVKPAVISGRRMRSSPEGKVSVTAWRACEGRSEDLIRPGSSRLSLANRHERKRGPVLRPVPSILPKSCEAYLAPKLASAFVAEVTGGSTLICGPCTCGSRPAPSFLIIRVLFSSINFCSACLTDSDDLRMAESPWPSVWPGSLAVGWPFTGLPSFFIG